jgi:ribose/xylose/arabinose/galactoside ABC-type transport system permease subunit
LWGREIYAFGGGRAESRAAGVPQRRPAVIAFAGFAALAAGLISIRSGSASPLGFEAVLLEAVAACLIGGAALGGGRGRRRAFRARSDGGSDLATGDFDHDYRED